MAENRSSGDAKYLVSGLSASFLSGCIRSINPFFPLNRPQHSRGRDSSACRSIAALTASVMLIALSLNRFGPRSYLVFALAPDELYHTLFRFNQKSMKLIFIYGPPATGKLTVATELAQATGFKLFHNHLSVNLLTPVFEFGSPPFFRLTNKFRLEIIEEAAKENISGLIFTFCYAPRIDDAFVESVVQAVERHAGRVCFVQLYCDRTALEERVINQSRKPHGKLNDVEALREFLDRYDLFSVVTIRESLVIDNSDLTAREAAQRIIARYELTTTSPVVSESGKA